MSIILLKTLHFLSLLFAGGVTVGSVVGQRAYVAADEYRHHMFARPLCFSAIWDWEPLSHYGLLALG